MKSYRKFAARAALMSCVSMAALGAATQPSFAEQQVIKFFVNGPSGSGFTGGLSEYHGPGYSHSQTPPEPGAFRTTSSGYGAISEASGIGIGTQGGAVVNTINDAFDGYGGINGGTLGAGTGAPYAPVANFGGLTVVRNVEVTLGPQGATALSALATAAGIPNLARWVDTFTNNTAAPITVTIAYENNLGSDSNTHYTTIGANNTFLTSQQMQVPCGTPSCNATDPTVTAVLGNNDYTKNQAVLYYGDGNDNPEYAFPITLAPGESASLVTFAILTADVNRGDGVDANSNGIEDALESDIALGQTFAEYILAHPDQFLSDLSADIRAHILNFNLCSTIDTNQPSYDESTCQAQAIPMVFDGGTLKPTTTASFNQDVTLDATGGTIDDTNGTVYMNGDVSGPGALTVTGGGLTVLNGNNSYTGDTTLVDGMLQLNGSNTGSNIAVTSGELIVGITGSVSNHTVAINGGSLYNAGEMSNVGLTFAAGTSGVIDTSGLVDGGSTIGFSGTTLEVEGSLDGSTLTMNSGTVSGLGQLGNTTVKSGAAIAPGNSVDPIGTLSVDGTLTLKPGSIYRVGVSGASSDRIAVDGAGILGGTVIVTAGAGSYSVGETYTIVTSTGRSGFFSGLTTAGFSHALVPTLVYTGTDTKLVLNANQLTPVLPSSATVNEANVAAAIDYAVAHDNALEFGPIFDQTGGQLEGTLDQMSGEGNTQAARGSFEIGSTFLDLMLDPTIDSRGGMAGASGPSLAYAPINDGQEHVSLTGARRLSRPQLGDRLGDDSSPNIASAVTTSAAGGAVGLWFSGYGQRSSVDGSLPLGTHQQTSSQAGFAGGVDWRPNSDTVVGLAGGFGHMGWRVDGVRGTGKADVVQSGVYGATRIWGAYVSAAFDYSSFDVKTTRTLIFGGTNEYAASYTGHGYGGRVEVGQQVWTYETVGITPYAAVVAQSYSSPAYSETTVSGSSLFAESVAAKRSGDVSTEVGFKTDVPSGWDDDTSLHTTLAWAHDYSAKLANTVVFTSLPGTGFTVHGAPLMRDAALIGLGLDSTYANGLSIGLKISGKFSGDASSYGGMGSVAYRW